MTAPERPLPDGQKMWGGRFGADPDAVMENYFDRETLEFGGLGPGPLATLRVT